MTYAPPMRQPPWTLSAGRLLPKWVFPESPGLRILPVPSFMPESVLSPIELPAAHAWLGSAVQRLSELADLRPGWDEASARPIAPALISTVGSFLASDLVSGLPARPDIVPTFEGGLMMEWHTEAVDLIIETPPGGEGSFYFCDNETGEEVEAALGDSLDAMGSAFRKLGLRL